MKHIKKTLSWAVLQHTRWITIFVFALHGCQAMEDEIGIQITTDQIELISEGCYEISCRVLSMGEGEVKEHGVCWSESENPETKDASVYLGSLSSMGIFKCTITDLSPDTRYYFRAFVVVNSQPVYGDEINIRTYPGDILVDIDGNIYHTTLIGDQTWMAENLNVTRYADGTEIPFVDSQSEWYHLTRESKAYCWLNDRDNNGHIYGALYTWAATVGGLEPSDLNPSGIQGVCPAGWHVPSDNEWKQLEMHLGMDIHEANNDGWRGEGVGTALKPEGYSYWKNSNSDTHVGSGFKALPGGFRHGSGKFYGQSTTARFWTASKNGYSYGWYHQLDYDKSSVNRSYEGVYRGHSVRCIKDQ